MKVHVIDTRQLGRPGIIAATALETNEGIALFDTGPESTFGNVTAGLANAGINPEDIRNVFVSHIHFDHAGAAWRFAERGATIHVHPRGAPHLLDPAKLVNSAKRIFGDDMEKLWGQIGPVPAERVHILQDNDTVRVAPYEIRAIETPGHASHHHVYHWNSTLFGGDIAGVRLGNGPPIPPFVPPELHIESWHQSIARMKALNATTLYLPHFGKVEGAVADHLDDLDARVRDWSTWLGDKIRQSSPGEEAEPAALDDGELKREFAKYEHNDLRAGGASDALIRDYETADPSHMAVTAAIRYWNKYHPEKIQL